MNTFEESENRSITYGFQQIGDPCCPRPYLIDVKPKTRTCIYIFYKIASPCMSIIIDKVPYIAVQTLGIENDFEIFYKCPIQLVIC